MKEWAFVYLVVLALVLVLCVVHVATYTTCLYYGHEPSECN